MRKLRAHEITLVAFARDTETGKLVVNDIVETDRHFASHFSRRFYRDREVVSVAAFAPGAERFDWNAEPRTINR